MSYGSSTLLLFYPVLTLLFLLCPRSMSQQWVVRLFSQLLLGLVLFPRGAKGEGSVDPMPSSDKDHGDVMVSFDRLHDEHRFASCSSHSAVMSLPDRLIQVMMMDGDEKFCFVVVALLYFFGSSLVSYLLSFLPSFVFLFSLLSSLLSLISLLLSLFFYLFSPISSLISFLSRFRHSSCGERGARLRAAANTHSTIIINKAHMTHRAQHKAR